MVYDLSALTPFFLVFALVAVAAGIVSVTVLAQSVVTHHRARVARHESIPTYYRGLVLAH
jgi:hypothetical protein